MARLSAPRSVFALFQNSRLATLGRSTGLGAAVAVVTADEEAFFLGVLLKLLVVDLPLPTVIKISLGKGLEGICMLFKARIWNAKSADPNEQIA